MDKVFIAFCACFTLGASTGSHPKSDFRHISYQDLQLSVDAFAQDGITTYSQLLFDVARNQVLVGARDALFRLSLPHLHLLENATWPSTEKKTAMCLNKGQSEDNCHNYIKVLLTNGKRILACGTESFSPSCTWREIENITAVVETVDGIARSPYNPLSNITALLTEDGEYYFGGPTDFSGSDFAIYRSIGGPAMRTQQYNSLWINEPHFVGSFETDKFVYFVFREAAVEYINCGKIVYSRIARVCKNDAGGQVMLKDNWTTFIKARLNCSITGDYPFYFDEIQSTAYIPGENILYATFTTPVNSIAGSAICAFNLTAINKAFSGPFKYQEHVGSSWNKHYSKNHEHFECKAQPRNKNIIESSKYQLMDSAVEAVTLRPLYDAQLERFTHITVDVLATKQHTSIHVIYVATQEGLIKKLTVMPRTRATCLVEVWNPVPDASVPILGMQYLKETNSVYVGTQDRLMRIPAHHCGRHVSKRSCQNAMDPYCGWHKLKDACTVAPYSDPSEDYWEQLAMTCPQLDAPVDGGWSSWSEWFPCAHRATSDPDSNDKCLCQIRHCNNPSARNGGKSCMGDSVSVTNCTVHGGWTAWSAWSECSATCGLAVKTRTRTCTNPAPVHRGRVCVGQDHSEVLCTGNPPCPVATPTPQDGGWSNWEPWSGCSSCGGGFRKRARRCNNPPPLSGGLVCVGTNVEYETCYTPCAEQKKVNFFIQNYTNANNEFVQIKYKYVCRAPVQNSSLIKFTQERVCKSRHCDEETARWGPWSEWNTCSVTCGIGFQFKERICEGRGECVGQTSQKRHCEMPPCNSIFGWEEWTNWSDCDENSKQYRTRRCRNITTDSTTCQGSSKETRMCSEEEMNNEINIGSLNTASLSAPIVEYVVCVILGILFGLLVSFLCYHYFIKRRKPQLPSSPHYMTAKSNQYTSVPLRDKPPKRQGASSSNILNVTANNGTMKSLKFDYDTIKRNSNSLNNGLFDDKFYE